MTENNGEEKTVPLITEELFREAYEYQEVRKPKLKKILKKKLTCTTDTFMNLLPILRWLRRYEIKKNLVSDVIAGVTVAIMHIPHGLAYAPLGKVNVVVGFYMAIFPVFIYSLLGTSRHISLGTFAVVCAMSGQAVSHLEHPDIEELVVNYTKAENEDTISDTNHSLTVAITVCFLVGIFQTALGLLKLGSFTVIMSESLVSGYTCGAAFHVLAYQIKNLFGVHIENFSGILKVFYIYIDFFTKIETVNLITMSISAACITILLFFNEFVKPRMQKRFPRNKIPIPIELIVIILGILASYFGDLSEKHGVRIVGHLPMGFPKPIVPHFEYIPRLIFDSFFIAVVAMVTNLSLAKIFAKKSDYEVSDNQELLAYGIANIFSSFFQCLPSAASLSRSTIQYTVGGKTQMASFFSMCIITFILLAAGTIFEPVPFCVLSSIVVVTLKGLLMQIVDLPKIWRQSHWDGIVWLTTFLAVLFLNLDSGIGVGLLMTLITITFRFYSLPITVLGRVRDTNIYLDVEHYKSAIPVQNILILQPRGGLNYTNSTKFESTVIKKFKAFYPTVTTGKPYVVIDLSIVSEVDPTAVNALRQLYGYLKNSGCDLYLSNCNVNVYRTFQNCDLFKTLPKDQILASGADAVDYLTSLK